MPKPSPTLPRSSSSTSSLRDSFKERKNAKLWTSTTEQPTYIKKSFSLTKTIKRHGSNLISNVPIIGPGSPKPEVYNEPPQLIETIAQNGDAVIAVIGTERVGKTTLIDRIVKKQYFANSESTIIPKFYARNVITDAEPKARVRLKFWDTPGDELIRDILPVYTRNSQYIFILFSLVDKESFLEAKKIMHFVDPSSKNRVVLVGSKQDLLDPNLKKEIIPDREINEFANRFKAVRFNISSYSDTGVDELINYIVKQSTPEPKKVETATLTTPQWRADESSLSCSSCKSAWTLANRRHHCRKCGNVFCGKCAYKYIPIPQLGKHQPTRVCNKCFDDLTNSS